MAAPVQIPVPSAIPGPAAAILCGDAAKIIISSSNACRPIATVVVPLFHLPLLLPVWVLVVTEAQEATAAMEAIAVMEVLAAMEAMGVSVVTAVMVVTAVRAAMEAQEAMAVRATVTVAVTAVAIAHQARIHRHPLHHPSHRVCVLRDTPAWINKRV